MYRLLTDEEIALLEDNGCQAENWEAITVAEDFKPTYVHNVAFYGDVQLAIIAWWKTSVTTSITILSKKNATSLTLAPWRQRREQPSGKVI